MRVDQHPQGDRCPSAVAGYARRWCTSGDPGAPVCSSLRAGPTLNCPALLIGSERTHPGTSLV